MSEELLSVGIDIGTSTTQLVFSKLLIENVASAFTVPRITISEKEIIYRSDIYFTPLISSNQIDGEKVRDIIELNYKKARVDKKDIQTGAVIITGETARKENAKEVLSTLSGFAGDFVVATAGPDLESIIAAKGAGAHIYSKEYSTTVVNIDIGGGTSNIALFSRGELRETGCLDIGGRLIKVDQKNHEITYIAPKIQRIIEIENLNIRLGMIATVENIKPIVNIMVSLLSQSVGIEHKTELFNLIVTNKSIGLQEKINCISFSGGVADYIYHHDAITDYFQFGDIGILLGQAIKESNLCKNLKVVKSVETIRATVVGAGSHTTEISGSTITYTEENFPIKNLPILKLALDDEKKGVEELKNAICDKLNWFKLENTLQRVAIGIEGEQNPSFQRIQEYAKGLVWGMEELIQNQLPLIIIVEKDMAKALGQAIYALIGNTKNLICLDSINVENGDYIDIGSPVADGRVLPVVIKTLVFN